MSQQHRGRNLYTLGDFHLNQPLPSGPVERLPPPDLFEGDPFKVNSYKFNYAEKTATLPVMTFSHSDTDLETPNEPNFVYCNQDFAETVSPITRMDEFAGGKQPNLQDFRKKNYSADSDFYDDEQNQLLENSNINPTSENVFLDNEERQLLESSNPNPTSEDSLMGSESNALPSDDSSSDNLPTHSPSTTNLLSSSNSGQLFANVGHSLAINPRPKLKFPWERECKTNNVPLTTSQEASLSMLRYSQSINSRESGKNKSKGDRSVTFQEPLST